ncbi:MAG: hypothetical protein ABS49_02900 [Erythrobacter sp. SCN 62-14]|nr:MAG: hypothetical protein ABS49_02900 [Erythrobacter sp. SCN 62-14]
MMMPRRASFMPVLASALAVAGCASAPAPKRPIMAGSQGSAIIRVPEVMQAAGLESVIGAQAASLTRRLGEPRLDLFEGDVRKLQFAGRACVMDVYLYPLQPGAEPVATHVEARLREGGAPVDRGQCLNEIARR